MRVATLVIHKAFISYQSKYRISIAVIKNLSIIVVCLLILLKLIYNISISNYVDIRFIGYTIYSKVTNSDIV